MYRNTSLYWYMIKVAYRQRKAVNSNSLHLCHRASLWMFKLLENLAYFKNLSLTILAIRILLLSICPYEFLKEEINYWIFICLQRWSIKSKSRLPWIAREEILVQLKYLELLRRNGVKKIILVLFSNSAESA